MFRSEYFLLASLLTFWGAECRSSGIQMAEGILEEMKDKMVAEVEKVMGEVKTKEEEWEEDVRLTMLSAETVLDGEYAAWVGAAAAAGTKGCPVPPAPPRPSLAACPQVARAVADGAAVAASVGRLSGDLLTTLQHGLTAIAACITEPGQSTWNQVVCYLGVVETLAMDIASNAQQVITEVNHIKASLADIKAAMALCVVPKIALLRQQAHDFSSCDPVHR